MTKTLYAEIKFVSLHQKRPSDYGAKLTVDGYAVRDKYGLEFGYGDPGEPRGYDNFDYAEFQITGIYNKYPGSVRETYEIESLSGAPGTGWYYKYSGFSVPDDFAIPFGLSKSYTTTSDIQQKTINADGSWSFDWRVATSDVAGSIVTTAINTGLEAASQFAAKKLVPQYAAAIGNAVSLGLTLYDIQKNGTDLISNLLTNFETMDPGTADRLIDSYIISTSGSVTAKLMEQLGVGNTTASSIVEASYETLGIVIKNIKPNDKTSGTVEIVKSYEYKPQYDSSSQIYIGSKGNDYHIGSQQRDVMGGGDGNDLFDSGGGNDLIAGGAGTDTAAMSGSRKEFKATSFVTQDQKRVVTITDNDLNRNGSDTLINVERVKFSDGTLAFDIDGTAGQAYRLYQAALNRLPDAAGLSWHVSRADRGTSLHDAAVNFLSSPEFAQRYGATLSDQSFVTALYANVLKRAPDAGGLAFWLGHLADRSFDRATVLAGFSESPENHARVDPTLTSGIQLDYSVFW
ncbi:DUF4214 domain-containing protein [Methylobacterium radiodurans]|uniref:DUF4214 domain-containing protein n=1 Tax=Methylobacterium radiodurans TaxID=2202828 RepID=A0A2U8VR53_9HYPH|nr:DUF4214 domain-containing protein [Methylobacterium radiodurans]AWN35696.1 hypothetical protein DK427_08020 [Methylobacterium radiodurans]